MLEDIQREGFLKNEEEVERTLMRNKGNRSKSPDSPVSVISRKSIKDEIEGK